MHTIMQDLINQADAIRPEGRMYSQANAQTDVGFVRCYRDYGVYRKGYPKTIRTNWRLNDKVISAANLDKLLNEGTI